MSGLHCKWEGGQHEGASQGGGLKKGSGGATRRRCRHQPQLTKTNASSRVLVFKKYRKRFWVLSTCVLHCVALCSHRFWVSPKGVRESRALSSPTTVALSLR
jgi:hypothetical protein